MQFNHGHGAERLKKYLSYGGGVNSTALLLLLHDEGIEFEAVYVDHGCDWPETRDYVAMLRKIYPITVITPQVKKNGQTFTTITEFIDFTKIIPFRTNRWCTSDFKVKPLLDYFQRPAEVLLGIDVGESHRAKMSSKKGIENRWPLIERDIDRHDCVDVIIAHGLPVPLKSGCWFCPFQRKGQWTKLRREHPDLWCQAVTMERKAAERARARGKKIEHTYLAHKTMPLDKWIDDRQTTWLPEMEFPPCYCGL